MGMQLELCQQGARGALPEWVPVGALHYIAHTVNGRPIRAIARSAGCHASTILRQIRKLEMRRDDPLVDAALNKLETEGACGAGQSLPMIPDADTLARDAMRVLGRLSETGALLAVAEGLDKAVVVRDLPGNGTARTAIVDSAVAQAMALNDWISPTGKGRVTRYRITAAGKTALTRFADQFGLGTEGLTPADDSFDAINCDDLIDDFSTPSRPRYGTGESPMVALARRRTKDGAPFLADRLVQAGEQLREDFELAQMDTEEPIDWDRFLQQGGADEPIFLSFGSDPAAARDRVRAAIRSLGPGLADVALRCCCYLEGLEVTEKRLGWSARSGKVVLRIALMALARHYDEALGKDGVLIG